MTVLPSKRHIPSILQMDEEDRSGLSRVMKEVTMRYDNLFE
jgi:UDPglucose--hexose-1-phosphate uridylyltransferase